MYVQAYTRARLVEPEPELWSKELLGLFYACTARNPDWRFTAHEAVQMLQDHEERLQALDLQLGQETAYAAAAAVLDF